MDNYKFGAKNNWRRWAWNSIKERLTVPARDAVVVYLPGPQDLDRAEALRRGFRPNNLIGVERDTDTLKALRSRGILCVDADFCDTVTAVGLSKRVDVVFGDFMCGLERRVASAIHGWQLHPALTGCVFAFNFQRGRDGSSEFARERFRAFDEKLTCGAGVEWWKHRGNLLLADLTRQLYGKSTDEANDEFMSVVKRFVMPTINSYASTGALKFDSCVFRSFGGLWRLNPDFGSDEHLRRVNALASVAARRKLAAILAHQTMRT